MSDSSRQRARELAHEATVAGDPVGWFEDLYMEAKRGIAVVPWADRRPNPHLASWSQSHFVAGPSLVVGCGLGDDVEWLVTQNLGPVVAFDVSTTAVQEAAHRFGDLAEFVVGDLFALPVAWHERFGFVLEAYTLQVLPQRLRADAIAAIAGAVRAGGTVLVIARGRDDDEPIGAMPWPLTRSDLKLFEVAGLRRLSFDDFMDPDEPGVRRFRVAFQRPR